MSFDRGFVVAIDSSPEPKDQRAPHLCCSNGKYNEYKDAELYNKCKECKEGQRSFSVEFFELTGGCESFGS